MSDNWIVQNLMKALRIWSEKLAEIWSLLTKMMEDLGYDIELTYVIRD